MSTSTVQLTWWNRAATFSLSRVPFISQYLAEKGKLIYYPILRKHFVIFIYSHYYYAIAKDFDTNFVALQAYIEHPEDSSQPFYLKHERLESLPHTLTLSKNASHNLNNVILYKIELPASHKKENEEHVIQVQEYHKGRREPYPKVIRVYEK